MMSEFRRQQVGAGRAWAFHAVALICTAGLAVMRLSSAVSVTITTPEPDGIQNGIRIENHSRTSYQSDKYLPADFPRKYISHQKCPEVWNDLDVDRFEQNFTFKKERPLKINTVMVASLAGGTGEVCISDGWRGELPRGIAQHLPNADVLIWHNARHNACGECFICTPGGKQGDSFDCDQWMRKHNRKEVDALLLIGSGAAPSGWESLTSAVHEADPNQLLRQTRPALFNVLARPWVTEETWTMHIPVSTRDDLNDNMFGFSSVVRDSDFPKPPSKLSQNKLKGCPEAPKEKSLLYIARLSAGAGDHKGHRSFLSLVPPEELEGYTIKFFGSGLISNAGKKLQEIADVRGIRIELHDEVSHDDLMEQICKSHGNILYSRSDANPRAAYEGLPAGNPVYVSDATHLPDAMTAMPFVYSDPHVSYRSGKKVDLPGFRAFMQMVRSADNVDNKLIHDIALRNVLDHRTVYHRIARSLGLGWAIEHQNNQTRI